MSDEIQPGQSPVLRFAGFRVANYTQVPNQLFDELLSVLTGNQLKVTLYVMRRTFGFGKDSDNISLNQMLHGLTARDGRRLDHGIGASKPTLLKTLRELTEMGIIVAERRRSAVQGDQPTNYRLNVQNGGLDAVGSERGRDQADTPVVRNFNQGPPRALTTPAAKSVDRAVAMELAPQKKGQKNNANNVNVIEKSAGAEPKRSPRSPSTIDNSILAKHYGLDEKRCGLVAHLVDLQARILGAVDRNHAAYVQRAAEAVRDGLETRLETTLRDFLDSLKRSPRSNRPAYFMRVWCGALKGQEPTILAQDPHPTQLERLPDRREELRHSLFARVEAQGSAVPSHLRHAPLADVARWFDSVTDHGPYPNGNAAVS